MKCEVCGTEMYEEEQNDFPLIGVPAFLVMREASKRWIWKCPHCGHEVNK